MILYCYEVSIKSIEKRNPIHKMFHCVTEKVGFEPTDALTSLVFKTRAINHSTTPPYGASPPSHFKDHRGRLQIIQTSISLPCIFNSKSLVICLDLKFSRGFSLNDFKYVFIYFMITILYFCNLSL